MQITNFLSANSNLNVNEELRNNFNLLTHVEEPITKEMKQMGNLNVGSGATIKDSFSAMTKAIPQTETNTKKVASALENVINNNNFARKLQTFIDIKNLDALNEMLQRTTLDKALKYTAMPDIETMMKERVLPNDIKKSLLEMVDKKPEQIIKELHKSFMKHFNVTDFRNTFEEIFMMQMKKLK